MSSLEKAKARLLIPASLEEEHLFSIGRDILSRGADYGDLYFQNSYHESWSLEDGQVKEGSLSIEQGVGVRAISGEKTGFAYSDEISPDALKRASESAAMIAKAGKAGDGKLRIECAPHNRPSTLYLADNPLKSLEDAAKVSLLKTADAYARRQDPRVTQVFVSLSGVHDVILVAATDGSLSADIRPLVRFNISVIVDEKGSREQGSAGGGGRVDYAYFTRERVEQYAQDAVRQALINLEAQAAPAGTFPVVLGSGWPGILLHEAVGHGLEGDFNRKGTSAYSGRIGERVASEFCTIVDDGTIADRRGSLSVDDEGVPAQNTVLIEKGILKGYMQDKHNAALMGTRSTGNGRRESYAHLPMPRMTNTYMLPGKFDKEDIISSVDRGIYAANFGGGQVDITSGKFVFSASEAYLIENGKVTRPIKGATLIGNGPDTMNQVSMVGNDLALDSGVGTCGKEGQSVPVGVGQPTLKIDQITIGGTAT